MKSLSIIFLTVFQYNFLYAQVASPGLNALIDNSTIIAQGVVLQKHCRPPMDPTSIMEEICVKTMKVESILKGAPLLSNLEIRKLNSNSTERIDIQFDTIKGLCFGHSRMRFPLNMDTLSKKSDYNVLAGDNIIVFLGERVSGPYRSIPIPNDWIVYTLIDSFLGVIKANEYVIDYINKRMK